MEQKNVGYVHELLELNVNRGSLWHMLGTKKLKLVERYCHSNPRYLHQRLLSKVS